MQKLLKSAMCRESAFIYSETNFPEHAKFRISPASFAASPLKEVYTILLSVSVYANNSSANCCFKGSCNISHLCSSKSEKLKSEGDGEQGVNTYSHLTLGKSLGPSKLSSRYLSKTRLSPMILLLCSSDGT